MRWQSWGCIAYTKCLIAVPIPPFWTPFTYAAAIIPERKGSSEKLSKLYFHALISRSTSLMKFDSLALPMDSVQHIRVKPDNNKGDSLVECYK